MLIFDLYAFMQGKTYHVSKVYNDFYIKHTISVDQYVASVKTEQNNNIYLSVQPDPKEKN
ncbi:hypothetical protein ACI01nite_00030 [Acetobacter cibinongensis]|uniref:Uncharacterized protein n=1 Tax=Acetobacter cibinongensis TaxID=146475 RepID=A0A0D6N6C1_9PROT|nr:hypothetical protein Abci_030_003 [Acetobacter cibinongensis]GBQ15950.1 hypothetical protein AA0482_1377 [Acetobacter cibinongensis NRIC 0482]GEL57401.1 hypothetical protein ACI01nite_00030 [Acetobacter cibinongensis]